MSFEFTVNQDNINKFAELSGDYNPLHVDELYARKTMFGKQMVHGIYQLMMCLEVFAQKSKKQIFINDIKAKFKNGLEIDEIASIKINKKSDNKVEMEVLNSSSKTITKINFSYQKQDFILNKSMPTSFGSELNIPDNFTKKDCSESLNYSQDLMEQCFPSVAKYINPNNISVLLTSTRIIGMKYPGLHSIYNALSLKFNIDDETQDKLYYDVFKETGFDIVTISLNENNQKISGELKSIIRPQLPEPKSTAEIKKMIKENMFKGQKALIIGGSRGIGLQCLKMLALGGAETLFSYYKNQDDAVKIKDELKLNDYNTSFFQLDIQNLSKESLKIIEQFAPTHLYYFATPHIINNNKNLSMEIFQNFSNYYIFALDKLINSVNTLEGVFYPSSTAITDLPSGMIEYAFAKSAAELYAEFLRQKRKIKIFNPRFPRIETSQTLSLLEVKALKPEDILKTELDNFLKHLTPDF